MHWKFSKFIEISFMNLPSVIYVSSILLPENNMAVYDIIFRLSVSKNILHTKRFKVSYKFSVWFKMFILY
jgi:hypothetical protein